MKNGIELIEPNNNMSDSYLQMAEESLGIIKKINESKLWLASASYYTMYYCLYSVMMKIGIKCEIHKCSIKFAEKFLANFYNSNYIELIKTAFESRNDLQYYPERLVDEKKVKVVESGAIDFFVRTKEILMMISEKEINQVRGFLKNE